MVELMNCTVTLGGFILHQPSGEEHWYPSHYQAAQLKGGLGERERESLNSMLARSWAIATSRLTGARLWQIRTSGTVSLSYSCACRVTMPFVACHRGCIKTGAVPYCLEFNNVYMTALRNFFNLIGEFYCVFFAQGQSAEAEVWFRKAVEMAPQDSSVYQHYGRIFAMETAVYHGNHSLCAAS